MAIQIKRKETHGGSLLEIKHRFFFFFSVAVLTCNSFSSEIFAKDKKSLTTLIFNAALLQGRCLYTCFIAL